MYTFSTSWEDNYTVVKQVGVTVKITIIQQISILKFTFITNCYVLTNSSMSLTPPPLSKLIPNTLEQDFWLTLLCPWLFIFSYSLHDRSVVNVQTACQKQYYIVQGKH